jgi:formate dehydrogenase subunit gamma
MIGNRMSRIMEEPGEAGVVTIRWIPKYTTMERSLHWGHTVTFLALAMTGMILFVPFLRPLARGEGGYLIRLVHRAMAIAYGTLPLIYVILEPRRTWMSLKSVFKVSRYDIEWVKGMIPYYMFGRHEAMAPQDRFNAGEKLNAVVIILGSVVFAVTGLLMWFGKGILPIGIFQAMVVVHDIAMIVTVCMFIVHFYLAVVHPLMWAGLVSMRFGVTSAAYAQEHHALWYYGPERARHMYETQEAAQLSKKQSEKS